MNRPKMILFDYGHTLCHEFNFSSERGTEAVLRHAARNKNNLTAKQVDEFTGRLFSAFGKRARDNGVEIHNHNFDRLVYEYLQIDIPLSPNELEKIFWDNIAYFRPMPNIEKALAYLRERGIRTGVISNISFGGETLKRRIDEILPGNDFELIIASSEYAIRKPDPMIFELALRKANLPASDVWFCGDSPDFDVLGASAAGIYPVWYHSEADCYYRDRSLEVPPDCAHLYIRDWLELIDALERMP